MKTYIAGLILTAIAAALYGPLPFASGFFFAFAVCAVMADGDGDGKPPRNPPRDPQTT